MYVSHLTLHDFRSYATVDVALEPGVTAFVGRNGQGKTNLVEAIDYLSRLTSHRVATDTPLVRAGCEQAVVRAAVVKEGRTAVLEVEINPGRANRARVNKSVLPRTRDLVGLVRTVVFSPEDLTLVKGDPSERRRFLDDLLVLRTPRLAGLRADYDRVLKQRNSLLKTSRRRARAKRDDEYAASTLAVWDEQLVQHGAELLAARVALVDDLRPYVGKAYETVARGASREDAELEYVPTVPLDGRPATWSASFVDDAGRAAQGRARPRAHAGRPAPRRAAADPGAGGVRRASSCRSRATPPTASRGRSRWRSAWRRTTCCAPTATTRSWSSTTCSPSSTPSAAPSSRTWWPAPSRCWSPRRSRPTSRRRCPAPGSWSPTGR